MNYGIVLALDPSGNFHEGKGTTGWCIYDCAAEQLLYAGSIQAATHLSMEHYWEAHLSLIRKYVNKFKKKLIIVIEDYYLYSNKASQQINSRMETPKLIGVLQHFCWLHDIPYLMQNASEVKQRWTDEILHHKRIIVQKGISFAIPHSKEPLDRHAKDSIRHAIHFAKFKNIEKKKVT